MKKAPFTHSSLLRHLLLSLVVLSLLLAPAQPAIGAETVVVVEDPTLHPAYTTCQESYWYPFPNNRGHTAYLTLNADLPNSTNYGEWRPVIPQSGYYKVEAYIPAHSAITWCSGQNPPTIPHDTSDARYVIHHAGGTRTRAASQYPLGNQWLDLGEYYFNAGQTGYVTLSDLNAEPKFTTTVSFSAMRFTFTQFTRPQVYLPLLHYSDPSGRPPPDRGVIQAQGFDACSLPAISTMQTWWNDSPYAFYALYIGGIQLSSWCTVASADWVRAVHQQGWSFVPTWVGPQAPCSPWSKKMSPDPAVSYQQGRQEALAASMAATALGLTNYGFGGTVIYYDMEVYGGASLECRQAAASFMNGWVERLHELGNIAGGYGARNSYVTDWAAIPHVPDEIWAASWYTDYYDPYASVSSITWLEGLWTNHQRIRQYAGDHNESWGGRTLNIDSDVADGMVAMPPNIPLASPVITASPSIEDAGWVTEHQGWLVSGGRLYRTDDGGHTWQDISPAGVKMAAFLPSGQGWALSAQVRDKMQFYATPDWGASWKKLEIPLPPDGWRLLQVQLTAPGEGWLVLQRETSAAFDSGILMKTSDGGVTWQVYDLPSAAAITFTSPSKAWMTGRLDGVPYHSTDGGMSWQAIPPEMTPTVRAPLPEGTTLSGWDTTQLGWAVVSTGSCTGEKASPGFACQIKASLQQSTDGGRTWRDIPLP